MARGRSLSSLLHDEKISSAYNSNNNVMSTMTSELSSAFCCAEENVERE